MKLTYGLLMVFLTGCQSVSVTPADPGQDVLAFIHDTSQLADGCEPYIALDTNDPALTGTQYKPSARSLPRLLKAHKEIGGPGELRTPVRVRFRETGKRVVIQCGWVSPTVSEIEILAITKR